MTLRDLGKAKYHQDHGWKDHHQSRSDNHEYTLQWHIYGKSRHLEYSKVSQDPPRVIALT